MRKFVLSVIIATISLGLWGQKAHAYDDGRHPRSVTLWWVIFNNPDACKANPGGAEQCGGVDVFGQAFLDSLASGSPDPSLIAPNVEAGLAVLFATGGVTGENGRIDFAASIYRSPEGGGLALAGAESIVDPMGLGTGLENGQAEIHLVLRDHGRRVRHGELQQISSFLDPYCSDPNLLYFAGENTCADVQFAVFGANESGRDDVYAFGGTPQKVHRAKAFLIRNGDAVQAFVETRLK